MGPLKTFTWSLFASLAIIVQALFVTNAHVFLEKAGSKNPGDLSQLLPIPFQSIFHFSWFRTLLEQSSRSNVFLFPSTRDYEGFMPPLIWIVTALTIAEWLTFAYYAFKLFFNTFIRPAIWLARSIFALFVVFAFLRVVFCYLAPALPPALAERLMHVIVAADSLGYQCVSLLYSSVNSILYLVNAILVALSCPSLEQLMTLAAGEENGAVAVEMLKKVRAVVMEGVQEFRHGEL